MNRYKKKLGELISQMKRNWGVYLCLIPFYIIFFTFTILPVLKAMYYSLCYFNILEKPVFIGLKNYINLFLYDNIFIKSLLNTIIFAIVTGPVGYIMSLLLAWTITDFTPRLRAVLVVVFYAPSISGQLYLVWLLLFSGDRLGFANSFLIKIGIISEPIQWFTDPAFMMPAVIVVALWMSLGAGFLSFIAGLQNVDKTLYESGAIDGISNRFQELWFITLPSIKPQLVFGAVMTITSSFAAADVMSTLTGFPSTDYATHTIVTHLMDYGTIRFDMGYACSIATVLFLLMIGINKIVQNALGKAGEK